MFVDDFRDWTGEIKLSDGSVIVATSLRGDKLIAGSVEFDRETGSAVTGQQIEPAELYRVLPETYLRRAAGKVAYEAYARTMKVTYPWDEIPVKDRHHWGLAILGVKEFAGRVLYDKFSDLVEGGLNGTPFLCWAALTDATHLAWGRAAAAGGAHVLNHRRVPGDLPQVSDIIRVLNALLTCASVSIVKTWEPPAPLHLSSLMAALNELWPGACAGRGAIMAICHGDDIQRFEPTDTKMRLGPPSQRDPQQGGVVPDEHGRPKLVMCGGGDGPAQAHRIPVHVNLPPPESMNGFADQFPGSDFPEPNPR